MSSHDVSDVVDLYITEHGRDGAEEILSERCSSCMGDEKDRVLAVLSELRQRGEA